MFDDIKVGLVEKNVECPMCGKELHNGDIILEDKYRGEIFCGYCKEDYKEEIIKEEGEDGRLLK
jgi:transcription elongation factor Elf1